MRPYEQLTGRSCFGYNYSNSGSDGKESACNAGDLGSTPGLGRSLENSAVATGLEKVSFHFNP